MATTTEKVTLQISARTALAIREIENLRDKLEELGAEAGPQALRAQTSKIVNSLEQIGTKAHTEFGKLSKGGTVKIGHDKKKDELTFKYIEDKPTKRKPKTPGKGTPEKV